ncbi:MAG TPA: hypothetical protein VF712_11155 [Thermoleophilaceae bacterium]|jgi:hypothetical protein
MDRTIESRKTGWGGALLGLAVVAQAACFAVVIALLAVAALSGQVVLGLAWLVALTLAGTALCSAALPVLVRHAQQAAALAPDERRRWLIRLAVWGPLAMPVYWRRFVA